MISKRERERRRRASRRHAAKVERHAILLILLAVTIAVICVSCALTRRDDGKSPVPSDGTTTSSTTTTSITSTTSTTSTTTTTVTTTTTTTATVRPTVPTSPVEGHYVQPAGAAWNLLLVNDWNNMPSDVLDTLEDNLVVYNAGVQNGKVDARIVDALDAMIRDCNAAGGGVWAQSCYRDYDTQEVLYEREVQSFVNKGYSREEAEIVAAQWVKRPGQSEHNTGLVVDFNYCNESFTGTKGHRWLEAHCAEYGFILRFPEGKEDVTGVVFESWHYRYVGVEAATEIMRDGITLEEYCEKYGY